jgi:hypothetical protein
LSFSSSGSTALNASDRGSDMGFLVALLTDTSPVFVLFQYKMS